ncbi:MAG: tetratricopeptide repeat protein, partial [Deltaproteobacteria bacterium]|nr:tetratricopeptide repeat protein [Deltaproteobacteria bacterium]
MTQAVTPEQKIEMYREQIRQRPENVLARFSLGQVLMKAERFEEAAGVWEELLGLKRDYLMAWVLYGRTLIHLGRRGEARRALEEHA